MMHFKVKNEVDNAGLGVDNSLNKNMGVGNENGSRREKNYMLLNPNRPGAPKRL